jgi:hypothetical protein
VLLHGYCLGVRSSRQLEYRLTEDIAFRVLAANQTPDHVTIARFRARHEQALAGFLVQSLKLCAAAGMVRVGTVALDGTKLAANAVDKANRTHDRLEAEVAEILRQAAETDRREDWLFGDAREDELPEALAGKADRLARLRQAKAQLEADAAREQAYQQRVAAHTAAAKAKGRTPHQLKRRPQETPNPEAPRGASGRPLSSVRRASPAPAPPAAPRRAPSARRRSPGPRSRSSRSSLLQPSRPRRPHQP